MAKTRNRKVCAAYERLATAAERVGETNDCSVKAIAAITGSSYEDALKALELAGRKPNDGASDWQIRKALESLGFEMKNYAWNGSDKYEAIKARYPEHHRSLKNITTYHPRRFPQAFKGVPDLLFMTDCHVAAFVGGEVVDWSAKNALRVYAMFSVEKI